jgi:hypothetical protein
VMETFADKFAVRDFVKSKVGIEVLVPLYAHAQTSSDIDWSSLPREFVAKVTHGCRGMIVVSEQADRNSLLPETPSSAWDAFLVHPDSIDISQLKRQLDCWLSLRYGWNKGAYREWAYSKVRPSILVERLMPGKSALAKNLKIACISSQAISFIVTTLDSSFTEHAGERYLLEDFEQAALASGLSKDELISVASWSEALCMDTDRARVDWLLTDEGVKFSEITNYPGNGVSRLSASPQRSLSEVEDYYDEFWFQPLFFWSPFVRRANARARREKPGLFPAS